MSIRQVLILAMATVLLLVAGCGGAEPTPSGTLTLPPAVTPLPPTETQVPPTQTQVPLTQTLPAQTPVAEATQPPVATSLPPESSAAPESAAGSRIAFYSERNGNAEIYVVAADGSRLTRLTDNKADDVTPDWSPDGDRLVFASDRDDANPVSCFPNCKYEIYVMNADGSGQERLTDTPAAEHHPAWSPAGPEPARIAFVSERDGNQEIYVMDADGDNQRRLTDNAADDMRPSWSPDGTQLAFNSMRDGNWEIYVMNADGSDQRPLTSSEDWEFFPDWSPDGRKIAFFACDPQCRPNRQDVYVMDVDGSNLRRLTDTASIVDEDPAWSPDGRQIVFQSDREGGFELYVMDADGGNQQRLTDDPRGAFWPAWGPGPAQASQSGRTRATDGMTMVYVPGGTYQMGSNGDQLNVARDLCDEYPDDYGKCREVPFEKEAPQHQVTLDSFWLDRTEVTNVQHTLCVADGACRASRLASNPAFNRDDYPVAGIPWQDAVDYCAWAGGRLPTEAEWEYAARGAEGTLFPWGDEFDCAGGNFWDDGTGCDDGYPQPAPVGSFPAGGSWCGALDLAGNVWEWVADGYGAYTEDAEVNPTGPASGSERILRGGSWGYLPAFVRSAYRYPVPANADYLAVGFRCAASVEE